MTLAGHTMYFAYDASGTPMALTYDGANYYYVTNQQGDVIAILDSTGSEVVHYSYDAWGNIFSTTGTLATTVGFYNPLRYRGYVYDEETELYYLQSRYYNPEMGRFINADGLISTGQGLIGNNMFAYCLNNPIVMRDVTGNSGILATLPGVIIPGVIILGVILAIPSSSHQSPSEEQKAVAQKAADELAEYVPSKDKKGTATIDVKLPTQAVLDTVDPIARTYFYEKVYENTLKKANDANISTNNLMSVQHISWEFQLHVLALSFDFEAAEITDLNIDETPLSMLARAIGW